MSRLCFLKATGVTTEPVITSIITGSGAVGTYGLSTQCPTTTGTQFTATVVLPEIQWVIYSTLLPFNDSPIGYYNDNLIGESESSSHCSNIIYHYPQPKPIMGNYQFTIQDFLGKPVTTPAEINAIVFIDFRLRSLLK